MQQFTKAGCIFLLMASTAIGQLVTKVQPTKGTAASNGNPTDVPDPQNPDLSVAKPALPASVLKPVLGIRNDLSEEEEEDKSDLWQLGHELKEERSSEPELEPKPVPATLAKRADPVNCYHRGQPAQRKDMIDTINKFCTPRVGKRVTQGYITKEEFPAGSGTIVISIEAIRCGEPIEGSCGSIFMRAVDECNTAMEDGKQGGTITSGCGTWRIDPEA